MAENNLKKEEKKTPRYNKWKFITFFAVVVGVFAGTRHLFGIETPLDNLPKNVKTHALVSSSNIRPQEETDMDTLPESEYANETGMVTEADTDSIIEKDGFQEEDNSDSCASATSSEARPNRVKGVWSYSACFPDIQEVQLKAAQKHGVPPVKNREEAEHLVKHQKLVNICHSPFYSIDELTHSIPYLVPRAQQLLNTICLNFIDSCQVRGLPIHLPIVTSVLRTTDDVTTLRKRNKNATENSCHCYGTTVDIAYNKFMPLTGTYQKEQELLRWNEPMKRVLSEVLNDLRNKNLCYVKYERKQGCFHLTCR